VVKTEDGKWQLTASDGTVIGTYPTNAEAWRAHDRLAGEHVNRSEIVADWFLGMTLPVSEPQCADGTYDLGS
jgi:hypothetical protein